jgi:hypothetical protein
MPHITLSMSLRRAQLSAALKQALAVQLEPLACHRYCADAMGAKFAKHLCALCYKKTHLARIELATFSV